MSSTKLARSSSNLWAPTWITIDGPSSKDLDDAICVTTDGHGGTLLRVAIADPTGRVPLGSDPDRFAMTLGATVYAREHPIQRMLPPDLTEDAASLVAGQPRPAVVIEVHVANDLSVGKVAISATQIEVSRRLSYADIPAILADVDDPVHGMVSAAATLSKLLLQRRRDGGALAYFDLSRFLLTDEDGRLRAYERADEMVGHIIVQEHMILANTLVAGYLVEHDIPGLFRNHEAKLSAPPAAELNQTLQTWMSTTSLSGDQAIDKFEQFLAVAGRARYGAVVKGHYALSLPCYAHVTSPLRRYADLVNVRQLKAHLAAVALPYAQAELIELGQALNDALDARTEDRQNSFKATLAAKAQRAVDSGNPLRLSRLADHELIKAIKLGREAGEVPVLLATEVERRIGTNAASDKLMDALLADVPPELLPLSLKEALLAHLRAQPMKAMHMVLHAQQVELLTNLSFSEQPLRSGLGFAAQVTATVHGRQLAGQGENGTKKGAQQQAATDLVRQLVGLPKPARTEAPPSPPIRPVESASAAFRNGNAALTAAPASLNPKGAVLELCAARRWPGPSFDVHASGPAHGLVFTCTARLDAGGQSLEVCIAGATSKKNAEALASQALLDALPVAGGGHGGTGTGAAQSQAAAEPSMGPQSNPVGTLQELAQASKRPMPAYRVSQVSVMPPVFEAGVTAFHGAAPHSASGTGPTKQAAKSAAAAALLTAV